MKTDRIFTFILGIFAALAFASCDSFVYEDEGDCQPYYKVRFRYVKHLKSNNPNVDIDAFASEVNAVTLYVVSDETGKIVWSKTEQGEHLASGDYLMDVPVEPGKYHLVAWCGEGVGTDFFIPTTDSPEGLTASLIHDTFGRAEADAYHVARPLGDLYHGRSMNQELPDSEGVHVYDVDLTKDTNDITILLQQTSQSPLREGQFSFFVTDRNHQLDWTNEVSSPQGEQIVYHEHTLAVGTGIVGLPADEQQYSEFPAVFAEARVSRLMDNQDAVLYVVNNETNDTVFTFPLSEYFLKSRPNRYSHYPAQEYLDRQDHYDLIFFLDAGYRWMNAYIYINSWKVVLTEVNL